MSFDSTYTTNQYNMIFAPFTGVNHHKQSIFLGAALISNEKAESYIWVFQTFLKAMGGKKPSLIITDEAASMKNAIEKVLPSTTHRLCMWHIMRKVPDKVEPSLKNNDDFYARLNSCVWGSENATEFEETWSALITDFSLEDNTWFTDRYSIRESWVPAYYKDIHLAGILRTPSRSESANSFFSHFIGYKYALVEFWLRFITALEEQRHNELIEENVNLQSMPELRTKWKIEKHASVVFTHKVFDALREYCVVESMRHEGEEKITVISDGRSSKVREVVLNTTTMDAHCTCKLFKSHGIPCRHVILVLRGARIDELPSQFVMKRWTKMCKKEAIFDEDGNLLEEKTKSPLDLAMQKKSSGARKDLEESIRWAAHSIETMDVVTACLANLVDIVRQMVPADKQTRKDEFESFLGCSIPSQIEIHPPSDVRSPGKCKRIKGHLDKGGKKTKVAGNKEKGKPIRMCSSCHQLGTHDKRTCHINST